MVQQLASKKTDIVKVAKARVAPQTIVENNLLRALIKHDGSRPAPNYFGTNKTHKQAMNNIKKTKS